MAANIYYLIIYIGINQAGRPNKGRHWTSFHAAGAPGTVGEKKSMTILNRLKYAFVINVIFAGLGVVVAMIFSLVIGELLISNQGAPKRRLPCMESDRVMNAVAPVLSQVYN